MEANRTQPTPMNSPEAPVLVTGGTGTLGRLVVERLLEKGRSVRVLTRKGGATAPNAATDGR